MQEKDREKIAFFRYGLIAPLFNGQVKNQKEYLEQISAQVHQVPYYGPKEFTPKTIECWLRSYRREGFDGLKPKRRSDRGISRIIPEQLKENLLELRKAHRDMPVALFYEQMIAKGVFLPSEISYSTLYRFLKKHDLAGKVIIKEPQRKRFAYDTVNMLLQGDMTVGPYLNLGHKKVRTFLFAFIDDCTRIAYGQFFTSEKFSSLKTVFKEYLIRWGIPRMVYVDNGKVYRSDMFHLACASLGITLIHTRPYDAPAKRKIERMFLTIKRSFFPLLTGNELSSLERLNNSFWRWLEESYHRKIHSALGMTPLDMYMSQSSKVRTVEDPEALDMLFLKREHRKVKHDGTISVNSRLFEVPPQFIGRRVEVRFDPENTGQVYIYDDGKMVTKARPVNLKDNALVKRETSHALSFKELVQEGED